MIRKLPRWVWLGGFVLAFIAGMVNVVGLLAFEHQAVSHLTGATSQLAVSAIRGQYTATAHIIAIICSFVVGAVVSGYFIQDSTLRLGRRYGLVLMIESLLLVAATVLLYRHSIVGVCFASCACGLQNAMASTYSGAIIRTTHMTGIFTDIGIIFGHAIRGIPVEWRRFKLFALIVTGFITGGAAAALVFPRLSHATLLIPAALTGTAGVVYSASRTRKYFIERNQSL